jgi:hypothetical protein
MVSSSMMPSRGDLGMVKGLIIGGAYAKLMPPKGKKRA